jgi:transcriptional regulator with XRE-family HTH domain
MRSLGEVLKSLPAERRAKVETRAKQLLKAETLRQLRAIAKKTQQDVAAVSGISQHNVSRLEQRDDMLLSTLNSYVGALGGKLRLVAEIPGIDPVELDLSGRPAGDGKRKRSAPAAA